MLCCRPKRTKSSAIFCNLKALKFEVKIIVYNSFKFSNLPELIKKLLLILQVAADEEGNEEIPDSVCTLETDAFLHGKLELCVIPGKAHRYTGQLVRWVLGPINWKLWILLYFYVFFLKKNFEIMKTKFKNLSAVIWSLWRLWHWAAVGAENIAFHQIHRKVGIY